MSQSTSQGTQPSPASAPVISSISPSSISVGSGAVTLQVTGSGFVDGSVVTLNGTALATTYVSSTHLSASVPPSMIAAGENLSVAVTNPGGQSSASSSSTTLAVNNGVPTITQLKPNMAVAGSSATDIQITGTGFVSASVASFQGATRPTTVQSSTQLTMELTAGDLAVVQASSITVNNPTPGGGTSNAAVFTVTALGAPVLTALSPSSATVGSSATMVTITGTGFTSHSQALANGSPAQTQYVSATTLTVTIPAADLTSATPISIVVQDPTGSSNAILLPVLNPVPVIHSLSPATITAGAQDFQLSITASGLVSGSQVLVNGTPRQATNSSGTLIVNVQAAEVASPTTLDISIVNPSPGGGTSNVAVLSVAASSTLSVTALSPSSVIVGSPDTTITITGAGFTPHSHVVANSLYFSSYILPHYVSATTLTVTIPAADLSSPSPISIAVEDPPDLSNAMSFAVLNPMPVIQSISPAIITAGAPDFRLVITASDLVTNFGGAAGIAKVSQVLVNGVPRETQNSSSYTLTVDVKAAEVAAPTTLNISIVNPGPGGGTSAVLKLKCITGDNRLRSLPSPANSLAWDAKQQRIYATIPASASSHSSSVVAIDPASGSVVASQQMPSEPDLLSITDDQQYLYVSLPKIGSIARLKLPSLAPDIQWDAHSPITKSHPSITALQSAPGLPHTVAVAQLGGSSKVLTIYDDGVARSNVASTPPLSQETIDNIQWGADASVIYGTTTAVSGGVEFQFSVNSSGATLAKSVEGVFGDSPIVYDPASAKLYDASGHVINPSTGKLMGAYSIVNSPYHDSASFAIDSTLDRAYFINGATYPEYLGEAGGTQIQVFNQQRHNYINALYLPSTSGGGHDLIRWGKAGLAFVSGNSIYILDGPFVAPGVPASSATGGYAVPAPVLSALSPESVMAGSADITITLSGQGFTDATLVTWNGNILESTLVSPTEMQVTIPAAALATPVAGPIIATNDPNVARSNPLGFTVMPNLGAGMQFTTLNVSGYDLVWNAAAGVLYESVTGQDLVHGNSIVSIDPAAGVVKGVQPMANEPYDLAISGDDQYLYAGFTANASVERFGLPAITPDLNIPLGAGDSTIGNVVGAYGLGSADSCDFAVSVQVAPNSPQTIAVTQGNSGISPIGCGAVAIFDAATPRSQTLAPGAADFSKLVWGADSTVLYAQPEISRSISLLNVSAAGVSLGSTFGSNNYLGDRPHFDPGTGYIYSDGGAVTNPADGTQVGNFMASGLMVPDSHLGRAFFLGQTPNQSSAGQNSTSYTLQIFDLKKFTLLDSIVIPNVIGLPSQMVRWGTSGIAFTTEGGDVQNGNAPGLTYILSGPILTGAARIQPVSAETPHVRLTWHPAQTRSSATVRQIR